MGFAAVQDGTGRIYVTGASGALGGALVHRLRGRAEVVAVNRAVGDMPEAGWFDPADAGATVIHAAGRSHALAEAEVEALARPHFEMFARLGEQGWRGRLVLLSSAAVYGEPAELPVSETAELAPVNAYGRHKLVLEQGLALVAASVGASFSALRLSNVYGTRRDLDRRRVVALLLDAAVKGEPFTTYGDGSSLRDYLHVADFCRAVDLATAAPPAVVNVGSGEGTSLNELIRQIEDLTGRSLDRRRGPLRAEAGSSVLDISRAAEVLGWRPEVGLGEGLAAFLGGGGFARPPSGD